jgi:RNA polymerase sigma-70 factor, ECF subfamily
MRDRPMNASLAQALREARLRTPPADAGAGATPVPAGVPTAAEGLDELALTAARGDAEAVGRLYDALVGPIYRYVAVRVRRREDAEDLTQVVFERIVASLPRYRDRGRPFEAWAFRIARNAVIDHARRERRHEPLDEEGPQTQGDGGPEAMSLRGEQLRELRAALSQLTADQQEAIALRFAAGLSAEEAARVMGRRAGTIRGLTFRAIASLRRRLADGRTRDGERGAGAADQAAEALESALAKAPPTARHGLQRALQVVGPSSSGGGQRPGKPPAHSASQGPPDGPRHDPGRPAVAPAVPRPTHAPNPHSQEKDKPTAPADPSPRESGNRGTGHAKPQAD